jgi:hypothetical protein
MAVGDRFSCALGEVILLSVSPRMRLGNVDGGGSTAQIGFAKAPS